MALIRGYDGYARARMATGLATVRAAQDAEFQTLLNAAPRVGDDATAQQRIAARRRRRAALGASAVGTRSGTLLTGPAGLTTPAPTERKTLLGL